MTVSWDRGVFMAGLGLWLDPELVRERAVVSHAHSDHARRHGTALLTPQTLAVLPRRVRPRRAEALPFGEAVGVGDGTLTLLPSGHMYGAAQALIELDGQRTLYTGDLALRRAAGERAPIPKVDVLVIESTYGRPHFRFPEPAEVVADLALWCRRLLERGVTPLLVGHALGKAQELMLVLGAHGFWFALDEACMEAAGAHERSGLELPDHVLISPETVAGRVAIAAPGTGRPTALGRYRSAMVSGWALEPGFWRRFGVDTAFPLSDHCDFDDLMQVVDMAQPKQVYTVHGFTDDLARHLRRRGVRAFPLAAPEQLQLAL